MSRSVRDGRIWFAQASDEDEVLSAAGRAREAGSTYYEFQAGGYGAVIWRVAGGASTQIASSSSHLGDNFDAIGSTLRIRLGTSVILQVTDTQITQHGDWRMTFGAETGFQALDPVAWPASGCSDAGEAGGAFVSRAGQPWPASGCSDAGEAGGAFSRQAVASVGIDAYTAVSQAWPAAGCTDEGAAGGLFTRVVAASVGIDAYTAVSQAWPAAGCTDEGAAGGAFRRSGQIWPAAGASDEGTAGGAFSETTGASVGIDPFTGVQTWPAAGCADEATAGGAFSEIPWETVVADTSALTTHTDSGASDTSRRYWYRLGRSGTWITAGPVTPLSGARQVWPVAGCSDEGVAGGVFTVRVRQVWPASGCVDAGTAGGPGDEARVVLRARVAVADALTRRAAVEDSVTRAVSVEDAERYTVSVSEEAAP